MTTVKINGVDVSTNYDPEELSAISLRLVAQDGEVGQGTAPVPDPAGTATPYAGQSFQVKDGATFVLDGFLGPITRERGPAATGTRLVNNHSVGDENAVLRGFRAYRWVRPSESTRARFLAFLAAFVPWVTDTTWVTSAVTATMAAKTYTTETLFEELFGEIRDLTGNTAFVENHRAHLHPPTNGITGGIAFSDTAFDFSSAFPVYSPKRSKDPLDLRDDVMVTATGGKATATDAPAIALYDAGGLKHQALVDIGTATQAEAAAKAAAILADSKAERITYEFDTGPMTAAQLATIPVGCLVNVTSAVLGLSSSTQRIAALTPTYLHPNLWKVHVECGYPIRKRRRPPPTVNPVDVMLAQAQLQACGSPMTLTEYKLFITEGVVGSWAAGDHISSCGGGGTVACQLSNNQSWPTTGCGVGTGAFYGHTDLCLAWAFTAPADSDQLFAQINMNAVSWGTNHINDCIAGTVPIKDGLLIAVVGGSSTPVAGDLSAPSAKSFGVSNGLLIPRSRFSFGAGNRLVVQPAEHVTTDYACTGTITNVGINDTGVNVTPTIQFYCLADGTYGWIDAPPQEAFNGSRTNFTLIGGYKVVDRASLNGVILPSDTWTATDGSTLQTLGWAPKDGDTFLVHYYIPR